MNVFRKRVALFWERFLKEEKQLRNLLDQERKTDATAILKSLVKQHIGNYPVSLDKKDHRYICEFSPQGDTLVYLYLHYTIANAPQILHKQWDFHDAMSKFEIRKSLCINAIQADDVRIYPQVSHQRLNLDIACDTWKQAKRSEKQEAIRVFLDVYIGEFERMFLIGDIKFLKRVREGGMTLTEFARFSEDLVSEKSRTYLHQIYSHYVILPRYDIHYLRSDVYSGVSSQMGIIHDFLHQKEERIRKAKEYGIIVGFLFYEHAHIEQEKRLLVRENLEEAISNITVKAGIAENIGAANGLMYTYLDYVIYDWDAFMEKAMPLLEDMDTHIYGFQSLVANALPIHLVDNRPKGSS